MQNLPEARSIRFSHAHRTDRWADRRRGQRLFLEMIEGRAPHVLEELLSNGNLAAYRAAINVLDRMGEDLSEPDDRVHRLFSPLPDDPPETKRLIHDIYSTAAKIGLDRPWYVNDALYTIDQWTGLPGWLLTNNSPIPSQLALPLTIHTLSYADHDTYSEWLRQRTTENHVIRVEVNWATHLEPWSVIEKRVESELAKERARVEEATNHSRPLSWFGDLTDRDPDLIAHMQQEFQPIKPSSIARNHLDWTFRHLVFGQSFEAIALQDLGDNYDLQQIREDAAFCKQIETIERKIRGLRVQFDLIRPGGKKPGRPTGSKTRKTTGLRVSRPRLAW